MKRLKDSNDQVYLNAMKHRLEENGIPAYISNSDTTRVIPLGILTSGLWIYIDEQHDEAMALLDDPDYEVQNQVDLEDFYTVHNNAEANRSRLNRALGDILIRGIVLLIAMTLFIVLYDKFYAS